jgi:hypothetical protein
MAGMDVSSLAVCNCAIEKDLVRGGCSRRFRLIAASTAQGPYLPEADGFSITCTLNRRLLPQPLPDRA